MPNLKTCLFYITVSNKTFILRVAITVIDDIDIISIPKFQSTVKEGEMTILFVFLKYKLFLRFQINVFLINVFMTFLD